MVMERIPDVMKEIREKKGRDWLGLQESTYEHLDLIPRYLCHPQIQNYPERVEELINLYDGAKASGFLKMEDIKRKMTQLKITIGLPDDTVILPIQKKYDEKVVDKPKDVIDDYPKAINDLKNRVANLLESKAGQGIAESTYEILTNFLHYLNHPGLPTKKQLFDDMLEKYNFAEAHEFQKMQAFNDILTMVEIKLGRLTEEMKQWKSPEEKKMAAELEKMFFEEDRKKVELEKQKFDEEWKKIEDERNKIKEERALFEKEKQKLEDERLLLKQAQTNLRMEKTLIETEKKRLERLKEDLDKKFNEVEAALKKT